MDYTENDKLVRGLDYYCETLFEVIAPGISDKKGGLAVLAGITSFELMWLHC